MPAKQRDRRFTEEDKRLLDAFANGVAGAVRNARLYTAMGRFIDEAAHELSTPLSTIDGFAGSLLRQLRTISRSGNSSRELRSATDSAKLIQGEIGRYQSVVMNLLYNARAERAAIALDKEPINVGQFLKEIVKMAKSRSLAQVKHLRITLSVPRQRLTVLGDKNALTQVLLNLLDNSLKFSPEGSEISVTATKSSSRKILFEVMDQGPGVPQDMRSKIFVKGVAMGNPSVGAKPGLGLGLWIANDIMRRHRSSIKVANQSKDGCKFYFTLPAHNNGG